MLNFNRFIIVRMEKMCFLFPFHRKKKNYTIKFFPYPTSAKKLTSVKRISHVCLLKFAAENPKNCKIPSF